MPPVNVVGRYWNIASDDFVFLGLLQISFQIIWLIILLIPICILKEQSFECNQQPLYVVFYIGYGWTLFVVIPITIVLIFLSSRGSIVDEGRRSFVPKLLIIKHLFFLPEAATCILGIYICSIYWTDCRSILYHCVLCTSVLYSLYVIGTLVFLWACYEKKAPKAESVPNLLQSMKSFQQMESSEASFTSTRSLAYYNSQSPTAISSSPPTLTALHTHKWERRVRLLLCGCCAANEEVDAIQVVAELLAYFTCDVNLVFSDLLAGLTLLRQEERQFGATKCGRVSASVLNNAIAEKVSHSHHHQQQEEHDNTSLTSSWLELRKITHYYRFAYGCYGWKAYLPLNICSRKPYQVCSNCKCNCGPYCNGYNNGRGDNCCSLNVATLVTLADIDDSSILFSSHDNEIYQSPFYVCVDHENNSIVLCIRGTLSLMDALTDLVANTEPLSDEEAHNIGINSPKTAVHRGMLMSARRIKTILDKHNVLDSAMETYPGYNLIITGHSLGAGIAAILSVLLLPSYPFLKCYSYAQPLSTMSYNLACFCQSFMVTVVVGYDIFTRLSVTTLEELKYRVSLALVNNTLPKHRLIRHLIRSLCCWPKRCFCSSSPFSSSDAVKRDNGDCEKLQQNGKHRGIQRDIIGSLLINCPTHRTFTTDLSNQTNPSNMIIGSSHHQNNRGSLNNYPILHMAGRILHIIQMEEVSGIHNDSDPYVPIWSQSERFQTIVIHQHMIQDHMPDHLLRVFSRLEKQLEKNKSSGVDECVSVLRSPTFMEVAPDHLFSPAAFYV